MMVRLTCENHSNLYWYCKEIAVSKDGRYNYTRTLYFDRVLSGEDAIECDCSADCLISLDALNK